MARSQPLPDWDWKSDKRQDSNDGRNFLTTSRTASWSLVRNAGSHSCGQLIVTDITPCGGRRVRPHP
jgi:hypothetical protein